MIIYVGGVPGVGKTTVIKQVVSIARKQGIAIEITQGIRTLCRLVGIKTTRELRSVPEEIKARFRPEMYHQIYELDKMDPTTVRIADGHFCFFNTKEKKYIPRVIQQGDKDRILFILVITDSPQNILKRRETDSRIRPDRQLDLNLIKKEQELELKIASEQAKELGKSLEILENKDGKLDETVSTFITLIKKHNTVY